MKLIRKFFNIKSASQKIIISKECDEMKDLIEAESTLHNASQCKYVDEHNQTCPKCGGKEIVNKIARVEGSGSVSGSFYLGSGSIYGSSHVDTSEVNNCNKCGNQWLKIKIDYKTESDIIENWVGDIGYVVEGKYSFGDKTFEKIKKFHAESILEIFNEIDFDDWSYAAQNNISLSSLRTIFKSVYQ